MNLSVLSSHIILVYDLAVSDRISNATSAFPSTRITIGNAGKLLHPTLSMEI